MSHYKNFTNATYAPAPYLNGASLADIEAGIKKLAGYVKMDKIYLETFRSDILVEREKMEAIKTLFANAGYKLAGGITTTVVGPLMGAMCYTDPAMLKKLGDVSAYTAELFDEVIIDDFYFTNCRCESCIKAKGDKDWATFRLELMRDVSANVLLKRAKEANPKVKVIIKYPNWYESFPACGYNLEAESKLFDGIYTGTETRDPNTTHQNLQRYLGYFLPRLMEHIRPGENGGGWHDLYECDLEDYVQQINLTLFAKCRENMHFCFPLMLAWPSVYMAAAGATSDEIDGFLGEMGEPTGVAVYKPYHSAKERHLYDFLGMLGLPLDPYPYYPTDASVLLLNEGCADDGEIVEKIKKSLQGGAKVFVTSGLYAALSDRGIRDILPMEVTGKVATADTFTACGYAWNNTSFVKSEAPVTLKHISYSTNDLWTLSAATTPFYSHPVLLRGSYDNGWLYVLNIPDDPADLYLLPAEVLTNLRHEMDLPVTLESGARVGLFLYDNDTFILHSFQKRTGVVRLRINRPDAKLTQLAGFGRLGGVGRACETKVNRGEDESVYDVLLYPSRYVAFRID